MKIYNSNIGKAKLRREQFNCSQNKSQFKGKKSLSKRIIAERTKNITKNNIEIEISRLANMITIENLIDEIMFHLKFGVDTRASIFTEEKLKDIVKTLATIRLDFVNGIIDTKQYIDLLKHVDGQIMENLNDLSQYH